MKKILFLVAFLPIIAFAITDDEKNVLAICEKHRLSFDMYCDSTAVSVTGQAKCKRTDSVYEDKFKSCTALVKKIEDEQKTETDDDDVKKLNLVSGKKNTDWHISSPMKVGSAYPVSGKK